MERIVLVLVAVGGCSGDDGAAVIMDVGDAAPAYGRAPFPTDAVRDSDHLGVVAGFDQLAKGHAETVTAHLAALDGFGLRPAIEFFVDGALDPASIPGRTSALTDALVLIDVDPGSPDHGHVLAADWTYDAERGVVAGAVVPGTNLREGTRYAAVITTAVRNAGGGALGRAGGLGSLGAARWRTTADAYGELRGMLGDRIAGLAVFTTEHASAVLRAARDVLATAVPPPAITFGDPAIIFDTPAKLTALLGNAERETTGARAGLEKWGTDNRTGMAHDHVGLVATGRLSIARFRGDDTGTDGPEDETFQLDAAGVPRVIAMETIPVSVVLPKAPAPATGFPVVIFQHGLGGSRHAMLNLAEPLTAQGYAVFAIDTWGHGSRYADSDSGNNLGGKAAFTGDRNLRDGFGDDPGTAAYLAFFEGFLNIAAIRDAMRQTVLDVTRLATAIQSPDLDLTALAAPYGSAPKLDRRHVAYLGESFGTIIGSAVAALEPSIDLYVLDVPGGGLLDQIFPSSAAVGSLAIPLVQQIYRTTGKLDRFHPLLSAMQAVFDGADPLTFAPHVLRDRFTVGGAPLGPRHVVLIEVMGDEIMSNAGTTALAGAFGTGVLAPYLDRPEGMPEVASPAAGNVDGQTAILVQYSPATHGYNWSAEHGDMEYVPGFPHDGEDPYARLPARVTIPEPIYETHQQVAELLAAHRAGQAPVVRMTKPPVHDFDADGRPDDQDPAPYDPSK